MVHDHQICDECIYISNIRVGKYLDGDIVCNNRTKRCSSCILYSITGYFVRFRAAGLDLEEHPIYVPISSSERLQCYHIAAKFSCGDCNTALPLWMLPHNKYLNTYFRTEEQHEETNQAP